jgi:hypothetical protein
LADADTEPAAPTLEQRKGTEFSLRDMPLLFSDTDFRTGEIWDEEHPRVPELQMMLRRDRAIALFRALSLPIMGAPWQIVGGNLPDDEIKKLHEGLQRAGISNVIGQMCQGFVLRRTYHEKVWKYCPSADAGKVGRYEYDGIEWRPPEDCVLLRDIKSGKKEGFKQAALVPFTTADEKLDAGWYKIEQQYAVTYIHNKWRNPVKGASDFDLVYWCYEQKMKLWYLWFRYCEATALPRTVVHARTPDAGKQAVQVLAGLANSGVAALPEQWFKEIQTLDISGKGAAEFQDAITALDGLAADSVLEGFLTLANAAAQNAVGSYALSNDLSDFFLQALSYMADEIAECVTCEILHDLVRYNNPGLKEEDYPEFVIGPISEKDATPTLELFRAIASSAKGTTNVPTSFLEQLILAAAKILDFDEKPIIADLQTWRAQDQAAQAAAAVTPAAPGQPGAATEPPTPGAPPAPGAPGAEGSTRSVQNPPKPANQPKVRPGLRLPGGG